MLTLLKNVEAARYDAFVKVQPQCNLLQSSKWTEIKKEWDFRRFMVEEEGQPVLAAQVLIRRLPLGRTLWYLPKGPILDYGRLELLEFFLKALYREAKAEGAAILKIDPPVELQRCLKEDYVFQLNLENTRIKGLFEKLGYHHQGFSKEMGSTIQPRFTAKVFDEGAFFESLPNRTKRFIKDAAKRGVKVFKSGPEGLDAFEFVVNKTVERKHVALRNRDYFERFFEAYGDDCYLYLAQIPLKETAAAYRAEIAKLEAELATVGDKAPKKQKTLEEQIESLTRYATYYEERLAVDGEVATLAGCLSVLYGHGLEMLYAGMNDDYAKIPAQFPVYVDSMQQAFASGADYASMGGVEGDLDDSLLTFKLSFSPKIVEEIGEFDLALSRSYYFAFKYLLPLAQKVVQKLGRKH